VLSRSVVTRRVMNEAQSCSIVSALVEARTTKGRLDGYRLYSSVTQRECERQGHETQSPRVATLVSRVKVCTYSSWIHSLLTACCWFFVTNGRSFKLSQTLSHHTIVLELGFAEQWRQIKFCVL
jgi:hypothetical protein